MKGHVDLLLLSILAAGPMHGYAVADQLRTRSAGNFDLPEGTIYPALHRLEQDRLLASRWRTVDGRRRRVYELTGRGRAALGAERDDWRRFVNAVDAVLETA